MRLAAGTVTELDVAQAETTLSQLEAHIRRSNHVRVAEDQLCILLGMPPADLHQRLGTTPIPAAAPEVVVGIPAELLCRRPDVRQAQFNAAAQAEQIGIAAAQFYPIVSLNGTIDYQAAKFSDLFKSTAFGGSIGPSFQWNILNYGRILNNFRYQDQKFRELLLIYCNTVLTAHQQVEDSIVAFLQQQEREKTLAQGTVAAEKAVNIVIEQYRVGQKGVDFNRVAIVEQALAQEQQLLAERAGPDCPGVGPGVPELGRRLADSPGAAARGAAKSPAAQCRQAGRDDPRPGGTGSLRPAGGRRGPAGQEGVASNPGAGRCPSPDAGPHCEAGPQAAALVAGGRACP